MFIEPRLHNERRGWIEVICGSMFSGKTEELIRRLKRAKYADLKVEIFKPEVDNRYDVEKIVSHDENAIQSTPISSSQNMFMLAEGIDVVGVDEAQFFDDGLAEVCESMALKGIRVIVAGLDKDYLANPFGPMPKILAVADYVTKLHAICVQCGTLATHSYRISEEEKQFHLGSKASYKPLCRVCYHKFMLNRSSTD